MISLEPSRFRSPLLAALPADDPDRDRRTLRRRRAFVVLAVVLVAVPAAAVKARWLSPHGLGYVFYRLHDGVYLPLKGYFFTRFHPGSWIYLLTAATLLLFALVAVSWKRPLTPPWHAVVGRRLLAWRRIRPFLRHWVQGFKRAQAGVGTWVRRAGKWPAIGRRMQAWLEGRTSWTRGPAFFEEVIEHEREAALEHLDALDPSDVAAVRAVERAADITVFSAGVAAPLHPREPGDLQPDAALEVSRLDQALLRLDLVRALGRDGAAADLDELRSRLESEIVARLRVALPRWLAAAPDFSFPALAADLALVLGLGGPPHWPAPGADSPEAEEEMRRRVLHGVDTRRRQLDESRWQLERLSAYGHRRRRRPPLAELSAPGRPLEARLALDVALFAALRYGVARSALAFLESLEGLRFALLMTGTSEMSPAGTGFETETHLAALELLPQPLDYRICACLLERRQAAAQDLEEAVRRHSEVLSETDLKLISARHDQLFVAAVSTSGGRAGS